MTICRFCPAKQETWTLVTGDSGPVAGAHAYYRKGGDISIPEWVGETHRPKLSPASFEVSDNLGLNSDHFRRAVAALGVNPNLVQPSQTQVQLKGGSKLLWTDGRINEECSTPTLEHFTFLLEYRLSEIRSQGGSIVRIIASAQGENAALKMLALQTYGTEVDSKAIMAVKTNDIDAAIRLLQTYYKGSRKSDDFLYVGWGSNAHIPIIRDQRLKPKGQSIAELALLWQVFGLSAFEDESFHAALSERQREFKNAFEASDVNPAIDYLLRHHSVIRCQRSPAELSIDGVPKPTVCNSVGEVSLLFDRFPQELPQRLLTDFRVKDGAQLTVIYPSDFTLNAGTKQWEPARDSLPPVAVSESCMLALQGKGELEKEFCRKLVRLDQSSKANDQSNKPFSLAEGDTLRGIVSTGSGRAMVNGRKVLLSPSEAGMMVVLLVEKKDESGAIVPFGCYATPKPEGRWAKLKRRAFNSGIPLSFSLNHQARPQLVVGTDSSNKPWACEITSKNIPA